MTARLMQRLVGRPGHLGVQLLHQHRAGRVADQGTPAPPQPWCSHGWPGWSSQSQPGSREHSQIEQGMLR